MGDDDGVLDELLFEFVTVFAVVTVDVAVVLVIEPVVVPRPPRPFAPPFRNLLWTELRVSVKLLRSLLGKIVALRPRFPRPLGVLESSSSVGESQNLGGAQS